MSVLRSALLAMLLFLAMNQTFAGQYECYFGDGWHVTETPDGIMPLSGRTKTALPINAYGWKLLSTSSSKSYGQKWYELPMKYQKWAWRVVIVNPYDFPIGCELNFVLKTDQGFVLKNNPLSEVWFRSCPDEGTTIQPKKVGVLSGTTEYNATKSKDLGQPSVLKVIVKEWGAAVGSHY